MMNKDITGAEQEMMGGNLKIYQTEGTFNLEKLLKDGKMTL